MSEERAQRRAEALTCALLGMIAMCVVACAHEALGHGSACLAIGGHITTLTTSIFRCDRRSIWIDPAGPFANVACGVLALVLARQSPGRPRWQTWLLFVTAFAFFWETGYCAKAMATRNGDLYNAAYSFLGASERWRWPLALLGGALYVGTARWTAGALARQFGEAARARRAARWGWVGASAGAGLAALLYTGTGMRDLTDTLLESAVAAVPMLWIPREGAMRPAVVPLRADRTLLVLALLVWAGFALTLGRGWLRAAAG